MLSKLEPSQYKKDQNIRNTLDTGVCKALKFGMSHLLDIGDLEYSKYLLS